jgi:hypothetical protein
LLSNGATMTPQLAWKSGAGCYDATRSRWMVGDANADGKDDIVAAYDYGNCTTGIRLFVSNGTTMTPQLAWKSGAGHFSAALSTWLCGDFSGDGSADVMAAYNYNSSTTGLFRWLFDATGPAPARVFYSARF